MLKKHENINDYKVVYFLSSNRFASLGVCFYPPIASLYWGLFILSLSDLVCICFLFPNRFASLGVIHIQVFQTWFVFVFYPPIASLHWGLFIFKSFRLGLYLFFYPPIASLHWGLFIFKSFRLGLYSTAAILNF
jgi:hypothetical protein